MEEAIAEATNVASLPDAELVKKCEGLVRDIALNIEFLRELRRRFEHGSVEGYASWTMFVKQNSAYSLRHIQRLLRGEGKHVSPAEPIQAAVQAQDEIQVQDEADETLPQRWHTLEREEPGGCTLPDLRSRINEVAKHFSDPFSFLGLTQEHEIPTGATQHDALRTRQTLDIPTRWKDLDGKIRGTTNVQWSNGQLLNRLIDAVEDGRTEIQDEAAVQDTAEYSVVARDLFMSAHDTLESEYELTEEAKQAIGLALRDLFTKMVRELGVLPGQRRRR